MKEWLVMHRQYGKLFYVWKNSSPCTDMANSLRYERMARHTYHGKLSYVWKNSSPGTDMANSHVKKDGSSCRDICMFLKSSISTSNLSKSLKMYLRRYWPNHILAKSYTSIGQIVYQYWWNRIPVLTKLYTSIPHRFTKKKRKTLSFQ